MSGELVNENHFDWFIRLFSTTIQYWGIGNRIGLLLALEAVIGRRKLSSDSRMKCFKLVIDTEKKVEMQIQAVDSGCDKNISLVVSKQDCMCEGAAEVKPVEACDLKVLTLYEYPGDHCVIGCGLES